MEWINVQAGLCVVKFLLFNKSVDSISRYETLVAFPPSSKFLCT